MTTVHVNEARLQAIREAAQANGADEHLIEAADDALGRATAHLWGSRRASIDEDNALVRACRPRNGEGCWRGGRRLGRAPCWCLGWRCARLSCLRLARGCFGVALSAEKRWSWRRVRMWCGGGWRGWTAMPSSEPWRGRSRGGAVGGESVRGAAWLRQRRCAGRGGRLPARHLWPTKIEPIVE